ncbi:helix-turn-helix domain-containing protein [Streptococcus hyointestinalis]
MKIESQSIFSIRLKELRISKGFTQSELGKKVGVSQNTFTNWENGSREPNFKTLRKLANVLETTIDYLLGEEEMTVQLVFASRLKVLRVSNGYSQTQIAQSLGTVQGVVSKYECGIREPDLKMLVKIADFYNVSLDYLLGRNRTASLLEEEE